jgi:hypothetical protein
MASPFVAARVNDLAVEVQLEENGPFYAVITLCGVDPLPLAHATDDDFVTALPELLQMAGVRDTSEFKEGEEITAELEDPDTNEIEDHEVKCTAAKLAIAKANPQPRSKAPAGADEEDEHMAEMDDAANHAKMEEMKAAQKKRMMTGMTAEAINSVIKMAKANGLAQEHIDEAFTAAGGKLPTAEDREAFENDDNDEDGGHPGAGGGQQCQQQ